MKFSLRHVVQAPSTAGMLSMQPCEVVCRTDVAEQKLQRDFFVRNRAAVRSDRASRLIVSPAAIVPFAPVPLVSRPTASWTGRT